MLWSLRGVQRQIAVSGLQSGGEPGGWAGSAMQVSSCVYHHVQFHLPNQPVPVSILQHHFQACW